MARSSEEDARRRRRSRLVKGLVFGAAAVGVPALVNRWVARRAHHMPDARWVGTADRFAWRHADVAYQRLGDGPAVVLLHAFGPGHSAAEWRGVAEELESTFEVLAPDLPGWGHSDDVAVTFDGPLHVQMLGDFLDQVVGRPAVVVGAGLAASYAARLAVDRPDAVRAVGLVTPLGLDADGSAPEWRDAVIHGLLRSPLLGTSAVNLFTSKPAVATYLKKEVYASPDLVDDALVDLHYFNSHRPASQRALADYLAGHLHIAVADDLDRLAAPAWLAWGRRATHPRVETADRWLARLPTAELDVFEQAGVLPHAESPGEFARKLEAFALALDDDARGGSATGER
ncbi:MAG: alpha/beta fold hydrolase [Acidobacteriota bacterium]